MHRINRLFHMSMFVAAGVSIPVGAQSPGETLWTFDGVGGSDFVRVAPTVADNGTVYFPADELYSIDPGGSVNWSVPLTGTIPGVASFDDGAVYAGAGPSVMSIDREDGTVNWTYNDQSTGLMAGPSVGPDGNVYAFYNAQQTGAISFTPAGDVRWTLPGFFHNGGDGWGEVAFASDRLFFADQNTPAPGVLGALVAIDFDGDILWHETRGSSGGPRPRAAPNENIYTQGSTGTTAWSPGGTELWSREGGGTFQGPGVGPDSGVYVRVPFEPDIVSYDAQGGERWIAEDAFPLLVAAVTRPAISPDNEVVVFGTTGGNGGTPLARIVALDASDGSELWSITLDEGLHVYAPPAFSPDGRVVYVGVENENGNGQLRAILAREGCEADLTGDGVLDLEDVQAFVAAFTAGEPAADFAKPFGVFDLADVQAFVASFNAGCP